MKTCKQVKSFVMCLCILTPTTVFAQDDVLFKNNFGGSGGDMHNSVMAVSDGIVAVGRSSYTSFGNGDWMDVTGKGLYDGIIVKYDNTGNTVWKKNFGGNGETAYYSVTAVSDGIVAVGNSQSFGNGDWAGVTGKGFFDAIIVKYDNTGNVVWKKNFGGSDADVYYSVTAVSDGIVAVGSSYIRSFGNGDWENVTGRGDFDAIIVKYDNAGNVVWKKNFGGNGLDVYYSVTTVSDGIVAVGHSFSSSFNNGDWEDVAWKGGFDAIIVKYDNSGNILWKKNFGGSRDDRFSSVTVVSDGIVAVGSSDSGSFGNNDWEGITGKGDLYNAIIVKYDNEGNVVWKKNFGGSFSDYYTSVTTVSDGIVAVGNANSASFGSGDWVGFIGKGNFDAITVKYDYEGNVVWKKNFGGDTDFCQAVTVISDGIVTVGYSFSSSFGKGDWVGFLGKGNEDATTVKYLIPVTDITDVPATTDAGVSLNLTTKVIPVEASYKTILWSVKNAGTTGATINSNTLYTTKAGTVIVTATIANGKAVGTPYTQDFTITVSAVTATKDLLAPELIIYPNPFTDAVYITNAKGCTLRIFTEIGTVIHVQKVVNQDETIRLEHLPASVYFFHLEKDGKRKTMKAIKN